MTEANPAIANTPPAGVPGGLLSSFASALEGAGAGGPFSNLLSQISADAAARGTTTPAANAGGSNVGQSGVQGTTASQTVAFPDTAALREVLNYLRAQANARSSTGANSANSTNDNAAAGTNASTGASTASDQAPDAATITEAMLEMQQLIQWIVQQLSSPATSAGITAAIANALSPATGAAISGGTTSGTAANGATGGTADTDPSQIAGTDPASGPSTGTSSSDGTNTANNNAAPAADALTAFLNLVQSLGIQFGAPTGALAAAVAHAASNSSSGSGADTTAPADTTVQTANTDTLLAANAAATPAAAPVLQSAQDFSSTMQIKAAMQKLALAIHTETVKTITGNTTTAGNTAPESGSITDSIAADDTISSTPQSALSAPTGRTISLAASENLTSAINPVVPAIGNLFRLFNNVLGTAAQAGAANFVPANTATMTGNQGGTDANAGQGDSGNDNSAASGLTANGNDATLPVTGGVQPTGNTYNFAGQLSAAQAATGTANLPSVLDQVVLSLNRGARDGQSQMTVQLSPADLGRINIKLNVSNDGKVQGTVVADNPATLDLLSKDVGSLERALQEAGLRADSGSLQFSLGGQQGGNYSQTAGSGSSGGQTQGGSDTVTPLTASDTLALALDTETYYLTPAGVNIKV